VTRRLAEENVNLAGGSLTEGQSEYLIRSTNQFTNPAEIGDVILVSRPDGVVRLADVAAVAAVRSERDVVARVDGREAVEISVYKEGDAEHGPVARAVKKRVHRLQLPSEMKLVPWRISRTSSRARSRSRRISVGSAACSPYWCCSRSCATARTTLIVAATIPVSVFATFVIMYRFGLVAEPDVARRPGARDRALARLLDRRAREHLPEA
jgi:HAE1 family hydrophobic/amphiphilic exporter-1